MPRAKNSLRLVSRQAINQTINQSARRHDDPTLLGHAAHQHGSRALQPARGARLLQVGGARRRGVSRIDVSSSTQYDVPTSPRHRVVVVERALAVRRPRRRLLRHRVRLAQGSLIPCDF